MKPTKKTLLWIGDSPATCWDGDPEHAPYPTTGFGRVSAGVLLPLAERHGWDVHVLAVNHLGDPLPASYPLSVYTALSYGDLYGVARVGDVVRRVRPDVVVMNNDLWVCREWHRAMLAQVGPAALETPVALYFPVDSPGYGDKLVGWLHDGGDGAQVPERIVETIPPCSGRLLPVTYTRFGEGVIRGAGYKGRLEVVPHGIDPGVFFPVDRTEARAKLGLVGRDGEPETRWILLNANRNQVRKRIDTTIAGFAEFVAGLTDEARTRVQLWLHMEAAPPGGWDVQRLLERELSARGVDPHAPGCELLRLTSLRFSNFDAATNEGLRLIYNAANAHINTASGEGWGLVTHEGAACGVPQIVPEHTAFEELWGRRNAKTDLLSDDLPAAELFAPRFSLVEPDELMLTRHIADPEDVAFAIKHVYLGEESERYRGMLDRLAGRARARATAPDYLWDNIAARWDTLLTEHATAWTERRASLRGGSTAARGGVA